MNQLVVKGKDDPVTALEKLLGAHRDQIALALPNNMRPERLLRLAVTALKTNTYLQNCSLLSIANSVMLSAQLGLEINNGLGHAFLVPYKGQCTFQPGYRGLLDLAYRSGQLKQGGAKAVLIYENEEFEYEEGENCHLKHKPKRPSERGDQVIACYTRLETTDGYTSIFLMWIEDILAVRDKHAPRDKQGNIVGPWATHEDAMIKKTVLKQHLKFCRLTPETGIAIGLDDQAEARAVFEGKENRRTVVQDMALDPKLMDEAIEADDVLEGSRDAQEQLKEAKLGKGTEGKQRGTVQEEIR